MDLVGEADQAVETSKQLARPIIAFHQALVEAKVEKVCVSNLTMLYAKMMLEK